MKFLALLVPTILHVVYDWSWTMAKLWINIRVGRNRACGSAGLLHSTSIACDYVLSVQSIVEQLAYTLYLFCASLRYSAQNETLYLYLPLSLVTSSSSRNHIPRERKWNRGGACNTKHRIIRVQGLEVCQEEELMINWLTSLRLPLHFDSHDDLSTYRSENINVSRVFL